MGSGGVGVKCIWGLGCQGCFEGCVGVEGVGICGVLGVSGVCRVQGVCGSRWCML